MLYKVQVNLAKLVKKLNEAMASNKDWEAQLEKKDKTIGIPLKVKKKHTATESTNDIT